MSILPLVAAGDSIRDLVAMLLESGFALQRLQDPGQASGPDFVRLIHGATRLGLDLQVARTDFETGLLARTSRAPGDRIAVATAEDLIVMKLIASRSKDHKDLLNLAVLTNLDWAYIEHWAGIWQVSDRLVELRGWIEADRQAHTGPPG